MTKSILNLCCVAILAGCATLRPSPAMTATVTRISAGRADVPGEQIYVLRSAGGRVFMTPQVIDEAPKIGDLVEIEAAGKGRVRIVGPVAR